MISPTVNTTTPHSLPISISSSFLPLLRHLPSPAPSPKPLLKPLLKPISATTPSSSSSSSSSSSFSHPQQNQQQQLYQPFRPPPSSLPSSQFHSLDASSRLKILSNRLGLWFDYAPIIPSLYRQGFTPSSIEESTGISGVEQNRIIVAAQVRDSLIQSQIDPETLSFFDSGGGGAAELLYEIRLLGVSQRASAARYVVENHLDPKAAQELARAMKDFPRRRGEKGWESFNYALPGDCLSFMRYRISREHPNPSLPRTASLESALEAVESDSARARIVEELEGGSGARNSEEEGEIEIRVPVVRMKFGEIAEAKAVVVLPLCRGEEWEKEVAEAPWECKSEGEFGAVVADKGWRRWVVLPGWEPVVGLAKGGVAISFIDARALPWKVKRWYKEEPILVVADRERKVVGADGGFYLVAISSQNGGVGGGGDGGLKVERGSVLKEMGVGETLGTVVLVVRPPKEEYGDQLSDDDWE